MEKKTSFIEEISDAVVGATHVLIGAIFSIARAAMFFRKPFETAELKFEALKKYLKSTEVAAADEAAAATAASDLVGGVSASIEALVTTVNTEGDALSSLGIKGFDLEELPDDVKMAVLQHVNAATKELLAAALIIDVSTDVDFPSAKEVEKASKAGKKPAVKKPVDVQKIEDRLFKVL